MRISVFIFFMVFCVSVSAATEKRIAEIAEVTGRVSVKFAVKDKWRAAQVGDILTEGAIVKTSDGATAVLYLDGKDVRTAEVMVKESSQMRFAEFVKKDDGRTDTLLDLAIGRVLIEVDKIRDEESKFEVKTPTSIVGVRGTVFEVAVDALE